MGCEESTSRCQSMMLIRTLNHYKPVIPKVPIICCQQLYLTNIIVGSL